MAAPLLAEEAEERGWRRSRSMLSLPGARAFNAPLRCTLPPRASGPGRAPPAAQPSQGREALELHAAAPALSKCAARRGRRPRPRVVRPPPPPHTRRPRRGARDARGPARRLRAVVAHAPRLQRLRRDGVGRLHGAPPRMRRRMRALRRRMRAPQCTHVCATHRITPPCTHAARAQDPGNWSTGLAGGARYGYALLCVVALSSAAAMLLQHLALLLGVAAGRDLAQACRDAYPRCERSGARFGRGCGCRVARARGGGRRGGALADPVRSALSLTPPPPRTGGRASRCG